MRVSRDIDALILIVTLLLIIVGLSLIYSIFHPHDNGYLAEADYSYFN